MGKDKKKNLRSIKDRLVHCLGDLTKEIEKIEEDEVMGKKVPARLIPELRIVREQTKGNIERLNKIIISN